MAEEARKPLPLFVQLRNARIEFWKANSLSIPARLVLVYLCDRCCLKDGHKRFGHAWPSQLTIQAETMLSITAVKSGLAELITVGAISRRTDIRSSKSMVYQLNFFFASTGRNAPWSGPNTTRRKAALATARCAVDHGALRRDARRTAAFDTAQCAVKELIEERKEEAIGRDERKDTPLPPDGGGKAGAAETREQPSPEAAVVEAPTPVVAPSPGAVAGSPVVVAGDERDDPRGAAAGARTPDQAKPTGAGDLADGGVWTPRRPPELPFKPRFDLSAALFDPAFKPAVRRISDCYLREVGNVHLSGDKADMEAIGIAMHDDGDLTEARIIEAIKLFGKHLASKGTAADKRPTCAKFFREGKHTQMLRISTPSEKSDDELRKEREQQLLRERAERNAKLYERLSKV